MPARADAARSLGLSIRAGLHTGEIELLDTGIGGLAVHIGARVAALGEENEVLVARLRVDLEPAVDAVSRRL